MQWIANGDIDGALREVTLDSLWEPGNATHGFMDFMLMMGVAGPAKADYADTLDLFHTMEAYSIGARKPLGFSRGMNGPLALPTL